MTAVDEAVAVDPLLFACPDCWAPTTPYRGHRSLCLSCTEGEVGETYEALRDRVSAAVHKGAKRKWSMWS